MQPELSVVMATANDYYGPEMTVQDIRKSQRKSGILDRVEFVVVDNTPDSPEGKELAKRIGQGKWNHGCQGTRYIPFTSTNGTAAPREHAIQQARGKIVMCVDSHILLMEDDSLSRLLRWFRNRPNYHGIVQGPMFMDSFADYETHFNPQWRDAMWGTWGKAWEYNGNVFSCIHHVGKLKYIKIDSLKGEESPVATQLGPITWEGHEAELEKRGCKRLGGNVNDEFVTPGMGLGLFAFRKEDWPGFSPHLRGFGGEELYIHEKFRQRGGDSRCLGFLGWWHRFAKPRGSLYKVLLWDKLRNNVLTHLDLGRDLAEVKEHFIGTGKIFGSKNNKLPEGMWEALMQKPEALSTEIMLEKETVTIDDVYQATENNPDNYFSQHAAALVGLVRSSGKVVEVSRYTETLSCIAKGRPKELTSYIYNIYDDPHYVMMAKLFEEEGINWTFNKVDSIPEVIEKCDLLIYKTPHNCETLEEDLSRWSPVIGHWIFLHDTERNGLRLDNGKPGYLPQIKAFLDKNPDWFILGVTTKQTGAVILSCLPQEKPEIPICPWPKDFGPGTELKKLFLEIGIKPTKACSCNAVANYMNMIECAGVEKEFDKVKDLIQKNYEKWGLSDRMQGWAAGIASIFKGGVVWEMDDKTDPVGSLIRLAVKKERERLAKEASNAS